MPNRQVHAPHYLTVEFVLEAVASWITKYRQASSLHNELGHCSPEDVMQIAKDLGVPVSELRKLATKGPGAADLIKKMLIALRVDPHVLVNTNPAVMRDLQRPRDYRRHTVSGGRSVELDASRGTSKVQQEPACHPSSRGGGGRRARSRSVTGASSLTHC